MKKCVILVLALLLCACTPLSNEVINDRVISILSKNVTNVKIAPTNRSKPYYRYYLPTDMGVSEANDTGAILNKDGYDLVLNFNTSNLIISEYYTDLSESEENEDVIIKHYTEESFKSLNDNEQLILKKAENENAVKETDEKISYEIISEGNNGSYVYKGHYDSAMYQGLFYQLKLKRVKDDYYVHMDGTIASLTCIVPVEEVDKMLNSMMIILKSLRYDKEKVLKDFSLKYDLKTMEEKFKENNEFIYQNLPSEGYLEDLIKED